MSNDEAEFSRIVNGKLADQPAGIMRKAGIATSVRIAASREKARDHYNSALFQGDVLLLSGSAWDDRTGNRIAIPEDALVSQIRIAIGDELYVKMLPWLASQAEYGVATWHFFILIDDEGIPRHPTPLQVAAMKRQP